MIKQTTSLLLAGSLLFVPSNLHHESIKPIYLNQIQNTSKLDNTNNKQFKAKLVQLKEDNFKDTIKEENPTQKFMVTGYTAFCNTGCIGITTTGKNVKHTIYDDGMRIIAVDPLIIPLYSIVKINYNGESFKAIALDTGGAIKGHHIDLLFQYREKAIEFGVRHLDVEIIRWGR